MKGPVLVATDLSQGADEAVRQADAVARHVGGPLHVCHVLPEILHVRMLFPQLQQQDANDMQALERKVTDVVTARVQDLTGRSAPDYAVEVAAGSPHAGILRAAEKLGAGVLVVGPGRVAERVARSASCHVLVARRSPSGKVLGATDFSDPPLRVEAAVMEARAARAARLLTGGLQAHRGAGMPRPSPCPRCPECRRRSSSGTC